MAVLLTGAITQKPFVRHSNYFLHYMKKVQQLEILILSNYYTYMVLKACPRETLLSFCVVGSVPYDVAVVLFVCISFCRYEEDDGVFIKADLVFEFRQGLVYH